jgi:polysaccharide export outer membrane protein
MSEFRPNASASVVLDRAASSSIVVLGEVANPGMYPLERNLRVTDLIARGGGPTELADVRHIRLIRRNGAAASTYHTHLDQIQAGRVESDFLVEAADIIYVPPTSSVSFGYAMGRALYPLEVIARIVLAPVVGAVGARR